MYSELYTAPHLKYVRMLVSAALIVVVATGIFFFTQGSTPTRASRRALQEHEIVNLSPKQVGVLWQVDEPDTGWIIYGTDPDNLSEIALDLRDSKENKAPHVYHYALLRDLEPDVTYYYKMVTDNELIEKDGAGVFSAQTLSIDARSSSSSPIYGKVLLPNGQAARGSFALVMVGNAFPLLGQVGTTGEWLVPLQYIYDKNSRTALPMTDETVISIQFFDDTDRSLVRSTISRSRPIPEDITLGSNYSFLSDTKVLSAQTQVIPTEPIQKKGFVVDIRFPVQDAIIPGVTPLIKGTGIPGKGVDIVIDSKPSIKTRVLVDDSGVWVAPIVEMLTPGMYHLTASTQDEKGILVKLTRTFTLIKSGERVLGEATTATPSGTLTPSVTKAVTPTVIVTTASPTPLVSAGPSVTPALVTATPIPPVSGTNLLPYMMGGAGMVIVGLGIVLLL